MEQLTIRHPRSARVAQGERARSTERRAVPRPGRRQTGVRLLPLETPWPIQEFTRRAQPGGCGARLDRWSRNGGHRRGRLRPPLSIATAGTRTTGTATPTTPGRSPPSCTASGSATSRTAPDAVARALPRRIATWLPAPAPRRGRLDDPARAAVHPVADPNPGRIRRSDDLPGECPDHGPTTPDATLQVYDDGHPELVTQAHQLAPVVTDFLLS